MVYNNRERTTNRSEKGSGIALNRRKVLQMTGVGIGVGALGPSNTAASSKPDTKKLGTVMFADAAVSHSLSEDYAGNHIDTVSMRSIDASTGRVYFPVMSEKTAQIVKRSNTLVHGQGFHVPPSSFNGIDSPPAITIDTNSLMPSRRLPIESDYKSPTVSLHQRGEAVGAVAEGRRVEVAVGDSGKLTLPGRSVDVEKRFRDPIGQNRSRRPDATKVETITVKPEVRVRNHGRLDVHVSEVS